MTNRMNVATDVTRDNSRNKLAQVIKQGSTQEEAGEYSNDYDNDIAVAAYYLAQQRGFTPGHELDDWLEAEWMINGIDEETDGD